MKRHLIVFFALSLSLSLSLPLYAAERIAVRGLFTGKALIEIDGKSRVMREGERSTEGVLLIHADSNYAEIELDGKRQRLDLGTEISSRFVAPKKREVTIPRSGDGMFRVTGAINGRSVEFLVDTGATTLALNRHLARRLALNYKKVGRKVISETAAGVVSGYMVKLDKVTVGAITLHGVEAVILEGAHPSVPLLGLSFLRRIELTQAGNLIKLTQ